MSTSNGDPVVYTIATGAIVYACMALTAVRMDSLGAWLFGDESKIFAKTMPMKAFWTMQFFFVSLLFVFPGSVFFGTIYSIKQPAATGTGEQRWIWLAVLIAIAMGQLMLTFILTMARLRSFTSDLLESARTAALGKDKTWTQMAKRGSFVAAHVAITGPLFAFVIVSMVYMSTLESYMTQSTALRVSIWGGGILLLINIGAALMYAKPHLQGITREKYLVDTERGKTTQESRKEQEEAESFGVLLKPEMGVIPLTRSGIEPGMKRDAAYDILSGRVQQIFNGNNATLVSTLNKAGITRDNWRILMFKGDPYLATAQKVQELHNLSNRSQHHESFEELLPGAVTLGERTGPMIREVASGDAYMFLETENILGPYYGILLGLDIGRLNAVCLTCFMFLVYTFMLTSTVNAIIATTIQCVIALLFSLFNEQTHFADLFMRAFVLLWTIAPVVLYVSPTQTYLMNPTIFDTNMTTIVGTHRVVATSGTNNFDDSSTFVGMAYLFFALTALGTVSWMMMLFAYGFRSVKDWKVKSYFASVPDWFNRTGLSRVVPGDIPIKN